MLPDKSEMSLLIAPGYILLQTFSEIIATSSQYMLQFLTKGCTQQSSPTPYCAQPKKKSHKIGLLNVFYSFFISLLFQVVKSDMMVFTQCVDLNSSCHFSCETNMVFPVDKCV